MSRLNSAKVSTALHNIILPTSKELASGFQKEGRLEDAAQAWEVAMGRSAQEEDWFSGVADLLRRMECGRWVSLCQYLRFSS
eukprot:Skav228092  [mRNA]  locus=scaffold784:11670:11915:+ [translate_table: standard]